MRQEIVKLILVSGSILILLGRIRLLPRISPIIPSRMVTSFVSLARKLVHGDLIVTFADMTFVMNVGNDNCHIKRKV